MKKKRRKKSKINLILIVGTIAMLLSTVGQLKLNRKPLTEQEIMQETGINYIIDEIPLSNKRPSTKMRPKYIVIHNTANPDSTAQNERDYLTNPINTASTSWHIAVDDKGAIQAIPLNEIALHSGSTKGNARGIGIEICESGDYAKAEDNAVKLIAVLMNHYNIPLKNIKTHQDFSGKECPRKILPHWETFLEKIDNNSKYYKY